MKIRSYSSGNQCFFLENVRKCWNSFPLIYRTSFLFWLFLNYFWTTNKLIKFLVDYRAHFFDFWLYIAGKSIFSCLMKTKNAFMSKSQVIPYECWVTVRTFLTNFLIFLTSRNPFWAKVPIIKVVQNDPFYRFH